VAHREVAQSNDLTGIVEGQAAPERRSDSHDEVPAVPESDFSALPSSSSVDQASLNSFRLVLENMFRPQALDRVPGRESSPAGSIAAATSVPRHAKTAQLPAEPQSQHTARYSDAALDPSSKTKEKTTAWSMLAGLAVFLYATEVPRWLVFWRSNV